MSVDNRRARMRINRRQFLQRLGAAAGSALWCSCAPRLARRTLADRPPGKLIYVAIDSLHPAYLSLAASGRGAGRDGDWLMPNLRRFLGASAWYPNAKCFLPSMTDTNHLNALAGTHAGQTGVLGVAWQFDNWLPRGGAEMMPSDVALARDDRGRPVDTVFHAWKRRWPDSPTAFIAGKGWVADMFRSSPAPAVDVLVTGRRRPSYLEVPEPERFADPGNDPDTLCAPRSPLHRRSGIYGAFEGQRGLMTRIMEMSPERFPHDRWIVDATLEVFAREEPELAYVLLAQADDAGHCLGAAWDPAEFVSPPRRYVPPRGCPDQPEYQLVSRRDSDLFLDPILDSIRDTDAQFGRLLRGLEEQGALRDATVMLLSDHAMISYLRPPNADGVDYWGRLLEAKLATEDDAFAYAGCSVGTLYWREGKERALAAKKLLLEHRARNPATGQDECPWWVLDRDEMRQGVPGICLPGELYHPYLVEAEQHRTGAWPDLFLFARNGWQLPAYGGKVPNTALRLPRILPPLLPFRGGHGSIDTLAITAAIARPGLAPRVFDREIRIADLAVTAAAWFGLELRSSTVGQDLRGDLG